MLVKDWITGFLQRHRARFAPADWPKIGPSDEWIEFTKGWITALSLRQVTEVEADIASEQLTARPPTWRREHIPAILEAIEALRREKGGGPVPTSREAAEAASKGCDRCGGYGLTTVWHPRPDPDARIPATTAAYCSCAAGRWIEKAHREQSPDFRRRFVDLVDVLAGRSGWSAEGRDVCC